MKTDLYRHYDKDGRLLYVGISLSTAIRLKQHRAASPWYDEVVKVTIEKHPDRSSARIAEMEAIHNEHPIHNSQHSSFRACVEQARASADEITKRIVRFKPLYSAHALSDELGLPYRTVKSLIEDGTIDSRYIPGPNGGRGENYATGWAVIDYLERLGAGKVRDGVDTNEYRQTRETHASLNA